MKYLIIIIGVLIGGSVYAVSLNTERIIKIGENNVEATKRIKMVDTDGKEVWVWDENNIQSYGHDRIKRELLGAEKKLSDARKINCLTYKQNEINEANKEVSRLNQIKTEIE